MKDPRPLTRTLIWVCIECCMPNVWFFKANHVVCTHKQLGVASNYYKLLGVATPAIYSYKNIFTGNSSPTQTLLTLSLLVLFMVNDSLTPTDHITKLLNNKVATNTRLLIAVRHIMNPHLSLKFCHHFIHSLCNLWVRDLISALPVRDKPHHLPFFKRKTQMGSILTKRRSL